MTSSSPERLWEIYKQGGKTEKELLVTNPSTPGDLLKEIALDGVALERIAAHPNLTPEIRQLLLGSFRAVEIMAGDPTTPLEFIRFLERGAYSPHGGLNSVSWTPGAISGLARNPNTSPEILTELFHRSQPMALRSRVASNPSTPPEVLDTVMEETQDQELNLMVLISLGGNPNISEKLLNWLATHRVSSIRSKAASNLKVNAELLERLITDESPHVQEVAYRAAIRRGDLYLTGLYRGNLEANEDQVPWEYGA